MHWHADTAPVYMCSCQTAACRSQFVKTSAAAPCRFHPAYMQIKLKPADAGTFKLTLEFAEDYPNKAPVVKIVSAMFHPNGGHGLSSCAAHPLPVGSTEPILSNTTAAPHHELLTAIG